MSIMKKTKLVNCDDELSTIVLITTDDSTSYACLLSCVLCKECLCASPHILLYKRQIIRECFQKITISLKKIF